MVIERAMPISGGIFIFVAARANSEGETVLIKMRALDTIVSRRRMVPIEKTMVSQ